MVAATKLVGWAGLALIGIAACGARPGLSCGSFPGYPGMQPVEPLGSKGTASEPSTPITSAPALAFSPAEWEPPPSPAPLPLDGPAGVPLAGASFAGLGPEARGAGTATMPGSVPVAVPAPTDLRFSEDEQNPQGTRPKPDGFEVLRMLLVCCLASCVGYWIGDEFELHAKRVAAAKEAGWVADRVSTAMANALEEDLEKSGITCVMRAREGQAPNANAPLGDSVRRALFDLVPEQRPECHSDGPRDPLTETTRGREILTALRQARETWEADALYGIWPALRFLVDPIVSERVCDDQCAYFCRCADRLLKIELPCCLHGDGRCSHKSASDRESESESESDSLGRNHSPASSPPSPPRSGKKTIRITVSAVAQIRELEPLLPGIIAARYFEAQSSCLTDIGSFFANPRATLGATCGVPATFYCPDSDSVLDAVKQLARLLDVPRNRTQTTIAVCPSFFHAIEETNLTLGVDLEIWQAEFDRDTMSLV